MLLGIPGTLGKCHMIRGNGGGKDGQCKEIEEHNRMGKTRDLFRKIRDTKGIFQAKMGTQKRTETAWT